MQKSRSGRRGFSWDLFFSFLLLATFVSGASAQSTIFIVRHAEKAAEGGNDPELSEAGRNRAANLAKILKDADIKAIYATEFKRTQETAEPLAKLLHLNVTVISGKNSTELLARLRGAQENSLVIGHSNTVPDLIKELGITVPIHIEDADYDNLFIVLPGPEPRLIRLHYP